MIPLTVLLYLRDKFRDTIATIRVIGRIRYTRPSYSKFSGLVPVIYYLETSETHYGQRPTFAPSAASSL